MNRLRTRTLEIFALGLSLTVLGPVSAQIKVSPSKEAFDAALQKLDAGERELVLGAHLPNLDITSARFAKLARYKYTDFREDYYDTLDLAEFVSYLGRSKLLDAGPLVKVIDVKIFAGLQHDSGHVVPIFDTKWTVARLGAVETNIEASGTGPPKSDWAVGDIKHSPVLSQSAGAAFMLTVLRAMLAVQAKEGLR